ncbi:hypothetical protein DMH03_41565 [Amycolatopsis sp. WAC 01376]|uniref:hypothetical protein n=1 Tax=Amycolatopsis sp. WAC 01376 TaxID=2203195 RepID=UPI000F7926CC|nr:hypothetical protein [Amycolatopsis sp. WAC 01376]RSM51836.1 hypothetical protein DMH03_41565 [Amycolatopsis sp. WAC 01376]
MDVSPVGRESRRKRDTEGAARPFDQARRKLCTTNWVFATCLPGPSTNDGPLHEEPLYIRMLYPVRLTAEL